jgi:hypothetical protein
MAFRKLLDEKASVMGDEKDAQTSYFMKKVHKVIKNIKKKLEKMVKVANVGEKMQADKEKLLQKLETLILTDLDMYLEKVKKSI